MVVKKKGIYLGIKVLSLLILTLAVIPVLYIIALAFDRVVGQSIGVGLGGVGVGVGDGLGAGLL